MPFDPVFSCRLFYFTFIQFADQSLSSLFPPTKFVSLSDRTSCGNSLRLVMRENTLRKESVSRMQAVNKCTTQDNKHVKRDKYLFVFFLPLPWMVINGPP